MMRRICYRRICAIVTIISGVHLLNSLAYAGDAGTVLLAHQGRDAQLKLDSLSSSHNLTTTVTVSPIYMSNNNTLRSRFKKPAVVLTLSLRPKKGQLKIDQPTIGAVPSTTADMTSRISDLTEAGFKLPTNANSTRGKPNTILDRLRKLTNNKIRQSGTDFGYKNSVALATSEPADTSTEKESSVPPNATKIGGHISHHHASGVTKSKPTVTVNVQPVTLPSPSSSSATEYPTTPNADSKLPGSGTSNLEIDGIEQQETRYITADQIGGNRPTKEPFHFTTSTTTTEAATTPRRSIKRYKKLHSPHNHIYAPTQDPISIPHHEDDLSVQDVQDYRAGQLTFGSKVGSDTGVLPPTIKPTLPPPIVEAVTRPTHVYRALPSRSRSPTPKKTTVHPQSASSGVKNAHIRIKPSSAGATAADAANDNLPFYKEPGGIFEHKYSDNDNEPNEVNHRFDNDRSPGVKYAPKGPPAQNTHGVYKNAQPQQSYQNPPQAPAQRHYTTGPVQSPQYVTVTQQPIYLSPVPVQHHQPIIPPGPAYNNYQAPISTQQQQPHHNYYPQQQPQQQYYHPAPAPVAPQPQYHQPIYNHNQPPAHVGSTPLYATHGQRTYPPPTQHTQQPVYLHQPQQPIHPRQNEPNRFLHNLNHPQTTPDYASQNIYNPPPSRYDPASDYYYGDPKPPKKPKPKPSAAPPSKDDDDYEEERPPKSNRRKQNRRPPPNDDDEEEEDYPTKSPGRASNRKDSSPRANQNRDYDDEDDDSPKGGRRGGGRERDRDREGPRRQSSRSGPGYNDDYDTDPNENVGEFVRPAELSQRAYHDQRPNQEFVSLDNNFGPNNGGSFLPTERSSNFRPSPPDNGPNFDHPNIAYPGRGSPPSQHRQQQHQPQQQRPQKRIGEDDDRFDTRLPPLDPIYTRTLQQYDEENQAPRDEGGIRQVEPDEEYPPPPYEANEDQEQFPPVHHREREKHRPRPQHQQRPPPEEDEHHEDDDEHLPRGQQPPPRNRRPPPPPPQEEEEEEEEPPPEEEERGRPQSQRQNDEEEEEEEEEPQQKPQGEEQKPQEDEEEEEEEEDENSNRRKSKRQPKEEKKPPPEKPKSEKSGNLDDDISAIEQEFGFTVPKVDLTL